MKKQSTAFVAVALLQTSIIIILFILGMIEAININGSSLRIGIYGAVGFTLVTQIVLLFFAFVYNKPGYNGKLGILLIVFLFLLLAASIVSLSYTICSTEGANINNDGYKVFGIISTIFTWVLATIFLICTIVYAVRSK